VMGLPIQVVDGGQQRRCFTYVDDGIAALMEILRNKNGAADKQIFNIGNPANDCSIRELAEMLRRLYAEHPKIRGKREVPPIVDVTSETYYGRGYQDIATRKPSIVRAQERLGWNPKVGLREALEKTLEAFIDENKVA
jgi:UDP-4-amino-4-deoxy-L-arabinose formyltransferase / UDP-glucuronic acid dehydrogenase (UDP-4-keto-hexauronic acid decarboxylating)